MDESKSKDEKPEKQRRFSQEQYDFLKQCSEKGEEGIKKWNQWRKENKREDICLEGANLQNFHLNGVWLHEDPLNIYGKIYMDGAVFRMAKLRHAKFWRANLKNADFYSAVGEGANFSLSRLEGTDFTFANLKKTVLSMSTVDGYTIFSGCEVDQGTYFLGVGLNNARIDPGMKQLLEYNIRRMNWEKWYEKHPRLKWLVKPFWLMSDYGLSTKRVVATFFGLAFIFANIYYHWGRIAPPGIVSNLFEIEKATGEIVAVPWWLVPFRTLYFSIVTMTTLGFGDMYANAHSIFGHILLSLQVILGYVLLGALITRFAILFTAGGPAGKFSNDK